MTLKDLKLLNGFKQISIENRNFRWISIENKLRIILSRLLTEKELKFTLGGFSRIEKKDLFLVTYLISKRSPFRAIQCFDSRFIQSNIVCHNILDYGIIEVLHSPTDNLIQEWAIYCELNELVEKLIDLDVYWRNKIHLLPELSALILVYI
ncbi:hypothetical protein RhiirC2_785485 [Rhizophagus irregularis]|uniref:Uncharacterized protein n=1 Tax=Rhizophagus irregularis TaxID=588596 RepID=A0A2N1MWF8_9GLOM|nr:hypothetical protein RhiirC2_785485 [Rhizophagus irregularis]